MAIKFPSRVLSRAPQAAPRRERTSRPNPIAQFIRDSRIELRKVVWPTRQEATRLTLVVIAVSVGVGLVLGGVDKALELLATQLVH